MQIGLDWFVGVGYKLNMGNAKTTNRGQNMNAAIKFNRLSTGRYISECGSYYTENGGLPVTLNEWHLYFLPVAMTEDQKATAKNSRLDLPKIMVAGLDTYGSSKRAAAKHQSWIASGGSRDTFRLYR